MPSDKRKNGRDLKQLRQAIGDRMMQADFEGLCLKTLKYASNPWEIMKVQGGNSSIGEPWVSCSEKKANN